MNYQKRTLLLIAIATLLRLIYSSATELGADEAYYWTYALKLQWNYFDHPPLVAWLIRLTTFNLSFHNEIFVRLGAVISAAICTWLIFKLGTLLHNLQTGWFAALIYTASIYCSITAGANILPDSPQLIFWLAGIFFFIKISRLEDNMPKAALLWCLFGLMSGLCIMCKAHGVLLWFGALLYVCFTNRHWFKYRGIYLSAVITLVIISPLVIWNIQNNFITYKFHTSRISMNGSGIQLIGFVKFIAQQIFINNPFNFFLICTSIFAAFKEKIPIKKKEIMILLLFSLPLIFLVLIISLFREAFPHWPAPGYTCLFILPAANLASRAKSSPSSVPNVLKWALGYMVIIGILQIILINYFPGTLSTVKQGIKTGNQDVTLCMYGWEEAGYKIDSLYKSDVTKKIMQPDAPIIFTNWSPASTIEFYVADKTKQEVLGIGSIWDLHQYYWSNKNKKQLSSGDNAYFIVTSDSFYFRTFNLVRNRFKSYQTPLVIYQYRGGIMCRYISVYRMEGYIK